MKAYVNRLLEFDRGELNDGAPIKGYVLDYNDDWTLLQVVEQDVFFNGYSIIRNSTVRKYREFDNYNFMVQRAMKKLGYVPIKPKGIVLTSLETIVLTANAVFPLVVIYREIRFRGKCHIGAIIRVTRRTITLASINPGATDGGPYRIRSADVTMVGFDGHYERALWAAASQKTKQRTTTR